LSAAGFPTPNQSKLTVSTNTPARFVARRVPYKKVSISDDNPNDSERRRVKRLSLFSLRDKKCACDEKFVLPFQKGRD
jgi:hypothetical protein